MLCQLKRFLPNPAFCSLYISISHKQLPIFYNQIP
jgi:hypothetical protein